MPTKPTKPTAEASNAAEAQQATSPKKSSAAQRRAVVEALASSQEPMTIQQIERAVGRLLPDAVRDSVEESVQSLIGEGQIENSSGDSRRLRLSDRGSRFAKGIQALAGG